jgi:hypothetical protein
MGGRMIYTAAQLRDLIEEDKLVHIINTIRNNGGSTGPIYCPSIAGLETRLLELGYHIVDQGLDYYVVSL